MNEKKQPPQDGNLGRVRDTLNEWKEGTKFINNLQVSISDRGVVASGYKRGGAVDNTENLKKREEGDISTWSRASQRKMKRFLMNYRERHGWWNYSLTLTVPGPVLTPEQYKELFRKYTRRLDGRRLKFLMVWRAEVQKRENEAGQRAIHWHAILSLENEHDRAWFASIWWDVIEELGAFEGHKTKSGDVISGTSRMGLAGAHGHSVKIDPEQENDVWWRYISDHATKSKQEQIGHDIGRHWGVIGKKYAVPSVSSAILRLTDEQWVKFSRFLKRLRTPRVKKLNDPFGFGLGWSPKMSRYGRSDYFGHQIAVERFLRWLGASSEPCPQEPAGRPQSIGG